MKLTKKEIQQIIKEELEATMSEGMASNEAMFVATYRAFLMNNGEQDVTVATQAAEAELEKLLNSPLEWAISMLSAENQKAAEDVIEPSKMKVKRPWPTSPSPMERSPHKSAQEE